MELQRAEKKVGASLSCNVTLFFTQTKRIAQSTLKITPLTFVRKNCIEDNDGDDRVAHRRCFKPGSQLLAHVASTRWFGARYAIW